MTVAIFSPSIYIISLAFSVEISAVAKTTKQQHDIAPAIIFFLSFKIVGLIVV